MMLKNILGNQITIDVVVRMPKTTKFRQLHGGLLFDTVYKHHCEHP